MRGLSDLGVSTLALAPRSLVIGLLRGVARCTKSLLCLVGLSTQIRRPCATVTLNVSSLSIWDSLRVSLFVNTCFGSVSSTDLYTDIGLWFLVSF